MNSPNSLLSLSYEAAFSIRRAPQLFRSPSLPQSCRRISVAWVSRIWIRLKSGNIGKKKDEISISNINHRRNPFVCWWCSERTDLLLLDRKSWRRRWNNFEAIAARRSWRSSPVFSESSATASRRSPAVMRPLYTCCNCQKQYNPERKP